MDNERTIFLVTVFNADGTETERLVNATTRRAALKHAAVINKASAADVALVLGKGGKVEEAVE